MIARRYLVTGATGFMGPHLLRRLASDGAYCRCLVRTEQGRVSVEELGAEAVIGDVTDGQSLLGIADGIDYVLHLATLGHMDNFVLTNETFHRVNVQGTCNVMREALRAGVSKVVHCSSVAAMGICADNPATEKSVCHPHHAYGRSKLEAEREVLRLVAEEGLAATIVRFSMVYGPGDWRDLLKLARLAKKGFWPRIGSRPKLTPLVHVEDAVQGLLLAVEKGRIGEIYLITNRRSEPFDRLRQVIQQGLGISRFPLYVPEWLALVGASMVEKTFSALGKAPPVTRKNIESTLVDRVFSSEKAQRELGFDPQIDPETGLRQTVEWYLENGWL
ncbi:MAG: NAD-dependent epimerase/dehydratase family protein [Chromatiaceae bacterium]|nr:NAD-dependent epimerase/dehydratase family protein [Chromatiaceae bacterium]